MKKNFALIALLFFVFACAAQKQRENPGLKC